MPPQTKASYGLKDCYRRAVNAAGVVGATVAKVDHVVVKLNSLGLLPSIRRSVAGARIFRTGLAVKSKAHRRALHPTFGSNARRRNHDPDVPVRTHEVVGRYKYSNLSDDTGA
ncbi:hypothetical protein C8J57DRAFT_1235065 [Mycena rebaudengoi]|nr:hypothetical protein C8J57DRAFT_1235065 [Mycena rebaudengoi]